MFFPDDAFERPYSPSTALQHAALEIDALSSAAFDATDFDRLEWSFDELPTPVDHVMVTAGGPESQRAVG
jgi:hypothetical protein